MSDQQNPSTTVNTDGKSSIITHFEPKNDTTTQVVIERGQPEMIVSQLTRSNGQTCYLTDATSDRGLVDEFQALIDALPKGAASSSASEELLGQLVAQAFNIAQHDPKIITSRTCGN
jgi:hypothetical protein